MASVDNNRLMTFQLIIIFPGCDNLPVAFLKINLQNKFLKAGFYYPHGEEKTDKINTWEHFTNKKILLDLLPFLSQHFICYFFAQEIVVDMTLLVFLSAL